jgi:hypothetical protein
MERGRKEDGEQSQQDTQIKESETTSCERREGDKDTNFI